MGLRRARLSKSDGRWKGLDHTCIVTMISHNGPSLIIYTLTPSKPTPVTVAGVAAYFVPPDYQDEEIIQVNTRYASPRIPDPLPHVRISRLTKAKPEEVELILKALAEVADVKALNFVDYYIFVELRLDGRQYQVHSLPGIVAGLPTTYHQAEESIWGKQMDNARTREIVPSTELGTQDTTDHSICGPLCPGVRLSSGSATSSGTYSSLSRSTTAGRFITKQISVIDESLPPWPVSWSLTKCFIRTIPAFVSER